MSALLKKSEFPGNIVRLANGLTVIHQHISATPVVVVDVWVKAGAIREPDTWSGMAHFLEHMIFKGTLIQPPGAFDCLIENRGGMTNAATSHDYAHFFMTVAAPYLKESLPALADLLLHPAIPDDEFLRERDVVLEEIRQSVDNPDWLGFQAMMETIYHQHPYRRPVFGEAEILMGRSPEEMRMFHRCHYQPENMTVAIVGNVTLDETLDLVQDSFNSFPTPLEWEDLKSEAEPPMTEVRRRELFLPRLEVARLTLAWTGPGVEELQDAYGLDLLAVVLAEGRNSRLVRELREMRGLVHGIGSDFSLQRDSSLFTIGAWLDPKHLNQVENVILDRIDELQAQPINPAELARAQRLLCNDYAFSTETPSQLAGLYGYYQTIADATAAVAYPDCIQSYNAADLQRVANNYLCPLYYAVTELKPLD